MKSPPECHVNAEFGALPDSLPVLVSLFDPDYFKQSRWFGDKDMEISQISMADRFAFELPRPVGALDKLGVFSILRFRLKPGGGDGLTEQDYFLPLLISRVEASLQPGHPETTGLEMACPKTVYRRSEPLLVVHGPSYVAAIHEGLDDPDFIRGYSLQVGRSADGKGNHGIFEFRPVPGADPRLWFKDGGITRIRGEYSNSLVTTQNGLIHKAFRRLSPGRSPELEISLALESGGRFTRIAPVRGHVSYKPRHGEEITLMLAQQFIPNEGDTWSLVTGSIMHHYQTCRPFGGDRRGCGFSWRHSATLRALKEDAATMGRLVGELHSALTSVPESAFEPEPIGVEDIAEWIRLAGRRLQEALDAVTGAMGQASRGRTCLDELSSHLGHMHGYLVRLAGQCYLGKKIRVHGDLHLGQWLKAKDGFYILDFEGEPLVSHRERRAKRCPLVDVSGMLRSFSYASYMGLVPGVDGLRQEVEAALSAAFLEAYLERIYELTPGLIPGSREEVRALLSLFSLVKVLYEVTYEAKNRPSWLMIPLAGAQDCLSEMKALLKGNS